MADDGVSQSLIIDTGKSAQAWPASARWPHQGTGTDRESTETYGKVACCFLGLYTWELVRAYQWELDIVRNGCWRRPALLGASLCRLCTLTALIGMSVFASHVVAWRGFALLILFYRTVSSTNRERVCDLPNSLSSY